MDKGGIAALIREAGVVGAGGAGFPTHVKVNGKAEYVIVNGAECEPLLRVDQQLMAHLPQEMLSGLRAVIEATGAQKGIIALKGKYKQAIAALEREIGQDDPIELFMLGDFYPAGDEQVTVYEVLQRIVPEGGIPLHVGAVVTNVETLLNIHQAMKGIPVTRKYVTVTGAVRRPITVKVPIGTRIGELIDMAGGALMEEFKVIDGGPMMGKVVDDLDRPVTKTTKGLIVLPLGHPVLASKERSVEQMLKQARTSCCHCSMCTEICPRQLLGHQLHPDKLMRLASYHSTCEPNALSTEAFLCSECRLCEIACVMNLQPWKLNQLLKKTLNEAGIKNPNNRKPTSANPFREYRKFPVKKLVARLGLEAYNAEAPLAEHMEWDFPLVALERKQHVGAKAEPIVQIGEFVTEGQTIAEIGEGQLGARIHSSISGIVQDINEHSITIAK